AESVGFRYVYDPVSQQFAHASAIMVLTPAGKISRYFYGLEYAPRDLQFGLIDASQNKIGNLADALILLCYHYDPSTAKYGLAVMRLIRGGGIATILLIGSYVFFMIRRERRAARAAPVAFKHGRDARAT